MKKRGEACCGFSFVLPLVVCAALAGIRCEGAAQTGPAFAKQGELVFTSKGGDVKAKIDIEIAETDEQRQQGLMHRTELGERQGMLFLFPAEKILSFWMKDTIVPLDMIFVNDGMEIVTIHRDTIPSSEQSYVSTKKSRYVVEVNAGFTEKSGIAVGDRVFWQRM
jgi:hypothetical protein